MNRWLLLAFIILFIIALIMSPGTMARLLLWLGIYSLLLLLLLGLPVAWLWSEFRGQRWLRILLGVLTLTFYVYGLSQARIMGLRFNYNAHYGAATQDLIKTSIAQIEDGNLDRVLRAWRGLDSQYRPTYQHRAGYQELVKETVRLMKDDNPDPDSPWDAPMFNASTWHGYWQGEEAFWLIIGRGNPVEIIHGSYALEGHKTVSLSPDYDMLTFTVRGTVLHRITLRNKYEALHEWFDTDKEKPIGTQTLHKLIRAPEEMKRMTQQEKGQSVAHP